MSGPGGQRAQGESLGGGKPFEYVAGLNRNENPGRGRDSDSAADAEAASLQEPAFGEADHRVAGDDQVVEDADVDESERVAQAVGD